MTVATRRPPSASCSRYPPRPLVVQCLVSSIMRSTPLQASPSPTFSPSSLLGGALYFGVGGQMCVSNFRLPVLASFPFFPDLLRQLGSVATQLLEATVAMATGFDGNAEDFDMVQLFIKYIHCIL